MTNSENNGQIILYSIDSQKEFVNVVFKDETFWLTQKAMAELFDVNSQAITKHLMNIFEEGELDKDSTCSKMEQVQKEGSRNVTRNLDFYNLDAIIAVGYRVNSKKAMLFFSNPSLYSKTALFALYCSLTKTSAFFHNGSIMT